MSPLNLVFSGSFPDNQGALTSSLSSRSLSLPSFQAEAPWRKISNAATMVFSESLPTAVNLKSFFLKTSPSVFAFYNSFKEMDADENCVSQKSESNHLYLQGMTSSGECTSSNLALVAILGLLFFLSSLNSLSSANSSLVLPFSSFMYLSVTKVIFFLKTYTFSSLQKA